MTEFIIYSFLGLPWYLVRGTWRGLCEWWADCRWSWEMATEWTATSSEPPAPGGER